MSDLTIAKTILSQLGGNRFIIMTGAKKLLGGDQWLSFRVPGVPGINYIKITLDPSDTYSIEAGRVHGSSYKVKHQESGVYCDQLQDRFTELTGLYTKL